MNIGIDIDDTISETFEIVLPYSQKYTIEDLHREPRIDDSAKCDNHLYIETLNGWSKLESENYWKKYHAKIMEQVNIKKCAAEVINALKKKGHKIFLISARWDGDNYDTKQITIDWLKENNVQYDELIINKDEKLEIARQKDIDIFIDDSFHNCKNIANHLNIQVLMMDSRANGSFDDKKVKRVFSWPEIQYVIDTQKA